jgi:hypothetical protein
VQLCAAACDVSGVAGAGAGGRWEAGGRNFCHAAGRRFHPPPPTHAHAPDKRDSAAERETLFYYTLSLALTHGIYMREKTRRRDVCMEQKEIEIICCILIPAASAKSPRHTHIQTHRRSLSCTLFIVLCVPLYSIYLRHIKVSQKALRFINFT